MYLEWLAVSKKASNVSLPGCDAGFSEMKPKLPISEPRTSMSLLDDGTRFARPDVGNIIGFSCGCW